MEEIVIGALSGGRDSSAAILHSLERGDKIDYIYFSDTLAELPLMYDYLNTLEKYISKNYGKQIIRLKPKSTFKEWVYGTMSSGKNKGAIRGLPRLIDPCYWRRESKTNPAEAFHKSIGAPRVRVIKLIGYTASEKDRIQKDPNVRYPLIEWGWCEGEVSKYLEGIGLVNPLYRYFSRTGCGFCPYQSLRSYFIIWKHFPETWGYMREIEDTLINLGKIGYKVVNDRWQRNFYLTELEGRFLSGEDNFSDTPDKDCLCAI